MYAVPSALTQANGHRVSNYIVHVSPLTLVLAVAGIDTYMYIVCQITPLCG